MAPRAPTRATPFDKAMMKLVTSLLAAGVAATAPKKNPGANTARWMTHSNSWGYLHTLAKPGQVEDGAKPDASVESFSDGAVGKSSGRLFFYLMGGETNAAPYKASLTLSQTGINGTCFTGGAQVDPEDPRCAKLTITGTMKLSTGADIATGKAALFARHPQMKTWPPSHGFAVHELSVENIWQIYFYGGGSSVTPKEYFAATPEHDTPSWPPGRRMEEETNALITAHHPQITSTPPPWNQTAARARWLVYHSIWTSIGTISVGSSGTIKGSPWGNIRSVADGMLTNSTGLPVLYVPTPDPTAKDLAADPSCTLSFSEAALKERMTTKGAVCGGKDAMDPTCARLHMHGHLVPLTDKKDIAQAEVDLGQRHPLAPWLAGGGAHTGGSYYTVHIDSLMFLDYYGGPAKLTPKDYMAAPHPTM